MAAHSTEQAHGEDEEQFESLAIKAAHGDTDAVQALPAAATHAREYYRNDKKYLDEAWAVMTPGQCVARQHRNASKKAQTRRTECAVLGRM
jgi:hypothetical protein